MRALEILKKDTIEQHLGTISKIQEKLVELNNNLHKFEMQIASTPKGEVLIYGGASCSCLYQATDDSACDHSLEMLELLLKSLAHDGIKITHFYPASKQNPESECLEARLIRGMLGRRGIKIIDSSRIE